MRLISAELTNICQFRYLPVKFAPGLTMIVGRNGAGKSNLVKNIYASITGDFGRNEGVKTDNISQLAGPAEPSVIHAVVEHGGSTLDITRSLRPATTRLRIEAPGVKPQIITKAQEATDMVSSTLGVSLRMLADYVFVDQWAIFNFLSMMPSERAKAFQRLFRTERAESLWKMLGDHIDHIEIPTPGIDRDAIIKRLNENREQHGLYRRKLEESSAKLLGQHPEKDALVIDAWKRRQALQKDVDTIKDKKDRIANEAAQIGEQLKSLNATDAELDCYLHDAKSDYTTARDAVQSWSVYTAVISNRDMLVAKLAELTTQLNELSVPVVPTGYVDKCDPMMVDWWKELHRLEDDTKAAKHFINMMKEDAHFCPTCGTPACELATHRAKYLAIVTKNEAKLGGMWNKVRISKSFDIEAARFQQLVTTLRHDSEQITGQLDQLPTVTKPDKAYEELVAQVHDYESVELQYKQVHLDLNHLTVQHERKLSVLDQLAQDFASKEAELVAIDVTEPMVLAAQAALDEQRRLRDEKVEAEIRVKTLDDIVRNDEMAIVQLDNVEKMAVTERAWVDNCQEMRYLLHRDNLPRLVAQNYLELMQDEINNLLMRFGSTFSVAADDTLSFTATFHDGRKIPAGRLSGGEKVLLALAFRVAVNDIFAKDLGLLVLDEPTAGLDEGNIGCLRVAIERLKELSTSRGLQVIMITHERELGNLFDHVIEVPGNV